jgi:hypothetical protein
MKLGRRFMSIQLLFRSVVLAAMVYAAGAGAEEFLNPDSTVPPEKLAQIATLIEKLNATENIQREEAEAELLKVGPAALGMLREAMKSEKPEVAARAKRLVGKLTEQLARPTDTYASVFPENTVFFLEAPNARQTLDKLKNSPLGKFWDLPAMQKFFAGHMEAQTDNDKKMLTAIHEFPKMADGRVVFALGDPDSSEAAELDPPLLYLMETKDGKKLETQVRSFFTALNDPPKATRRYGPFSVEEHTSAQTIFGETSVIHALTIKGIESFVDYLVKRPEKPLSPRLKEVAGWIPNHDFIYSLTNADFQRLSDDGQMVDDDQIEALGSLGFVTGSTWQGAIEVTPEGFQERFKLGIPDKTEDGKNDGFMHVLKEMAKSVPPAPKGDAPHALDMIPWQAGLIVSFNGDTSKFAEPLAKSLREYDTFLAPLPRQFVRPPVRPGQPGNPAMPAQPGVQPVQPGAQAPAPGVQAAPNGAPNPAPNGVGDGGKGLTPAQQALAEAGVRVGPNAVPNKNGQNPTGAQPGGNMPALPQDPAERLKMARAMKIPPHVSRFEKLGLKMEQFFAQVDGPVVLALFFHQIEAGEVPDYVPVSPLFSVVLKDPKPVEQALEAASAGPEPRFTREVLNGGMHYVENAGDPDTKPGFWLKDNRLAWSTERDLLELAGAALMHKAGNERYSDRANFKKAQAVNQPDSSALLSFFGDAEQCMEMPYKLAVVNWQEDEDNPWPDYAHIKALLAGKNLMIEIKSHPEGLEGRALTPFSLFGLVEAVRRTLNEAAFW